MNPADRFEFLAQLSHAELTVLIAAQSGVRVPIERLPVNSLLVTSGLLSVHRSGDTWRIVVSPALGGSAGTSLPAPQKRLP